MQKKVILSGGHATPALALVEELHKDPGWKVFYVGRKNATEGDDAQSLEYEVFSQMDVEFLTIPLGRLSRFFTFRTIVSFIKFPISVVAGFLLLRRIQPTALVSFGSYVALPLCLSAALLKIPIFVHEQTHVLGFANKIIAQFAQKVFVSWNDTENIPPQIHAEVIGNLLRSSFFIDKKSDKINFGNKKLPLLYITGGSQGSQILNKTVESALPILIQNYRILHQCGKSMNALDYKRLVQLKSKLPKEVCDNYMPVTSVDPSEVGTIFRSSKIIIGRSGANTTTEILASCTPSILIPLPWSGALEQEKNALYLQKMGGAVIIAQNKLDSTLLLHTIEDISNRYGEFSSSYKNFKGTHDSGAEYIVTCLNTVALRKNAS